MRWFTRRAPLAALAATPFLAASLAAQGPLSSPKAVLGANVGDDYTLFTYTQFTQYVQKLAGESPRMRLDTIGRSEEGRPHLMAIITSPENHKNLARYREIAQRLARAEGLTDDQAKALAKEGKAVVWIDGGLHATEVVGPHQLIEIIWQLNSRTDEETQRILNDVIVLATHANPDGMELVSSWYMRNADPLKRRSQDIPVLYEKYAGHDNNRDSFMGNLAETRNMNRILYQEWFPQIMYNHHQTGPAGTVIFAPPFRDPFNFNYDPLIPAGLDLVGASMHNRFIAEGKPGAVLRSEAPYSTWWNGGLRTTVYFHNMIGLLTEIIGNPTPMEIPFIPYKLLPSADRMFPITPQKWHFRQSIDYSITSNYAVLDIAQRHREQFLYNIYQMGRNAIKKGNEDTWTITPTRIAAVQDTIAKARAQMAAGARDDGMFGRVPPADPKYFALLRKPEDRDPRGYIIPADQPDFLTARKFVNIQHRLGVVVHRATAEFTVNGKRYPQGSYVIKTAQAFRPHVMDMFEPQDHPNDFAYPGGPPKPPYDNAGWTLAMQMGFRYDRMLDAFDGPFERLRDTVATPRGMVAQSSSGWFLDRRMNDAVRAANRLVAAKATVSITKDAVTSGGKTWPAGTFYVSGASRDLAEKTAAATGVDFAAAPTVPAAQLERLQAKRVALWDRYGGSMPSGWTRYLFEQYEQPFSVVYMPDLDAGRLRQKYDVIIMPSGAVPGGMAGGGEEGFGDAGGSMADDIPPQYRGRMGRFSREKTLAALRQFVADGGTLVGVGTSAAGLASGFELPVKSALVQKAPDGRERPLSREQFYVPGSILRAQVDVTNPLAAGSGEQVDVFYNNSPAFTLGPDALAKGVRPIAWFGNKTPLRSGWAWGQGYLENAVTMLDATVGRGKLVLLGAEVTNRAQPHGTFKFLFNAIAAPTDQGKAASVMQ
ncbi:MAG: M14 family metallopeptidase [Gemmatimonadaceae bacterium]|nr:M14 family metallopeptidase [Gemmatimonadaceae bacterium]